jgi:hypothetical protein
VSNDWVVRHHNRYLQLQPTRHQRRSPRVKAVLLESEQGAIEVCYGGESMALTELSGPPPRAPEGEQETTVLLTTPPRQPGGPVRGAGNQRSAGRRSGQARRCLPSSSMHALRPSMPLLPLSSDAHRATRRGFGWPPGSSACLLGTLIASAPQPQRVGVANPFHSAACRLCVSVPSPAPAWSGWQISSPPYGGCSETVDC